jgi:5'-methylthioadenosine phosphorylase
VSQLAILTDTPQAGESHDTSYGTSSPISSIKIDTQSMLLCSPTTADPRATIHALKDLGATHLWLCESVGSLSSLLEVGDWVVADDYIDGTRGQHYTYFSEKAGGYVQQVPAFDVASREALIRTPPPSPLPASKEGGRLFRRGVYVCVSNTRFETLAEATFWSRAGGHVVGRYLSPYLMLARELEIQVAVLAHITRVGGLANISGVGGGTGQTAIFKTYTAIISRAWEMMERPKTT